MPVKKLPSIEAKRKLAISICDKANITVTFKKKLAVPCAYYDHSGNAHILLDIPSLENIGEWEGNSHHEISHLFPELKFTYDALKIGKFNNLEHSVANILADNLCEKARHGEYLGRDSAIYTSWLDILKRNPEYLTKTGHMGIAALRKSDLLDRITWQGTMPEIPEPEGLDPYLDRFKEIDLYNRLDKLLITQSTDDFLQLINEVCEEILRPIEREKPKELEGDGKGEGESKGKSKSKSKGKSGGKPKSGGSDEDYDPSGEGSGEKEEESEPVEADSGEGEKEEEKEKPKKDISKVELPKGREEMKLGPPKDLKTTSRRYVPFVKKIDIIPDYNVHNGRYRSIERYLRGNSVSKRIIKYLKIMSKAGYQYGQPTGRINGKAIYKTMLDIEKPGIFKKKNQLRLKADTAVSLLLDCSGSMYHSDKYAIGAACCIAISQTLNDIRVVHEVLGFSERYKLWTYIFKSFGNNVPKERLLQAFSSRNIDLVENADGESVLYAAERLDYRKERNKLLIVLSDGYPAGNYTGDGHWYLKLVCKAIEASHIDLIGIGIRTSAVQRFYKNNVVVNELNDLNRVLFEALKRNLVY